MLLDKLRLLRCSSITCRGRLELDTDTAQIYDNHVLQGDLSCIQCGKKYSVVEIEKVGIPNLLPPIFQRYLESGFISRSKLLKSMNEEEQQIVKQIAASEKMAPGYLRYVVDYRSATSAAYYYERYEDLVLRDILERCFDEKRKVVLIELGSGPGRYLVQYGAKVSKRKDACLDFRTVEDIKRFYAYDKRYDDYLKLIIGVDFSQRMIRDALRWLTTNKLDELVYTDRILQVLGIAQHLNLSFEGTEYQDCTKVVACVFQTLGNQVTHELQIKLLEKMKEIASSNGIVVVSVFSKEVFSDYLEKYYGKITKSIGKIIFNRKDLDNAVVRTKKGVYSRWMTENELLDLLIRAGFQAENIEVKTGVRLPLFKEDFDYVPEGEQEKIQKRGIIATVKQ